jgi:hypothetical protein
MSFLTQRERNIALPARQTPLRAYGGSEPITALVFIDADAEWNAFPRIDIVAANSTGRCVVEALSVN